MDNGLKILIISVFLSIVLVVTFFVYQNTPTQQPTTQTIQPAQPLTPKPLPAGKPTPKTTIS